MPVLRLSKKDVENVYQLCSRFTQRLNVLTVRFAFSFATAALNRRFEHPSFRHTREGGDPSSKSLQMDSRLKMLGMTQ
jgi:hypothetical protein